MKTIEYTEGVLRLLDQTLLPHQCIYRECVTCTQVAEAIRHMVVRGAPAIGVTAAYGMAISASSIKVHDSESFYEKLKKSGDELKQTRPTAVNLSWAVDRILKKLHKNMHLSPEKLKNLILEEAELIEEEDLKTNKLIGENGSTLLKENTTVLTHCNAGALATSGYGTALGVIRAAHSKGLNISVYADETRPYLQGARLTSWELMQDGIPVTLICDSMAGHFMKQSLIDCVIVGADRIAANGDTANKIGTYTLSVLARENEISFFVAAPLSTVDFSLSSGKSIPIEERSCLEVTSIAGKPVAPAGVKVRNPAFDVSPSDYITAIITEKGIVYPPYEKNLAKLKIDSA